MTWLRKTRSSRSRTESSDCRKSGSMLISVVKNRNGTYSTQGFVAYI